MNSQTYNYELLKENAGLRHQANVLNKNVEFYKKRASKSFLDETFLKNVKLKQEISELSNIKEVADQMAESLKELLEHPTGPTSYLKAHLALVEYYAEINKKVKND